MTHHLRPSRRRSTAGLLAALVVAGLLTVPAAARAPSSAHLRIAISEDVSGGIPIEGSVQEIDVSRVAGRSLTSVFHATLYVRRAFTLQLRPGTYRTTLAVRTCSGTCANLDDPPATRCARTTVLRARDRVSAHVRIVWGSPTTCQMALRRG